MPDPDKLYVLSSFPLDWRFSKRHKFASVRTHSVHTNFSKRTQPHYREVPISHSDFEIFADCDAFLSHFARLSKKNDFLISLLTMLHPAKGDDDDDSGGRISRPRQTPSHHTDDHIPFGSSPSVRHNCQLQQFL